MELAELIELQRGSRTYSQLEADSGYALSAARWQQLATGQIRRFPAPESVTAIAAALDVSEETVLLSVAITLGIRIHQRPRIAELIPDRAANLPDQSVAALIGIVRAMCAQEAREEAHR